MQKIRDSLYSVLLFLSVSACSDEKTVHWKQEVLLKDGRVIIVERESTQAGKIYPEGIIMEKSQRIIFVNPDTGEMLRWNIPKGLLPYTLDFSNKTPYLVLSTYTVADYNDWGCPNPPYLVYRYKNSTWNQISFEYLPAEIERRNLIDMAKTYEKYALSDIASLRDVEKFLDHRGVKRRSIFRERINSNAEGCLPSVLERLGRSDEITEKYYRKENEK